jgi:hypothetical protein
MLPAHIGAAVNKIAIIADFKKFIVISPSAIDSGTWQLTPQCL